jgi:tRNA(Ile)-lysidine synthase TilS/MesJ
MQTITIRRPLLNVTISQLRDMAQQTKYVKPESNEPEVLKKNFRLLPNQTKYGQLKELMFLAA